MQKIGSIRICDSYYWDKQPFFLQSWNIVFRPTHWDIDLFDTSGFPSIFNYFISVVSLLILNFVSKGMHVKISINKYNSILRHHW